MTLRLAIFGFIAFPAHIWLEICAYLIGIDISYKAIPGEDEELER